MKRLTHMILRLAFAAIGLALAAPCMASSQDPTSWTSADGVTIRARLAGWDGRRVFLVKDGRHFEVPLSRLSPASLEKAKRLLEVSVAPSITPPPGCNVPSPSSATGASPRSLKDRHGMPILPQTQLTRVVRTTAYSCLENDHLAYGSLSALGTPLQYGSAICSAAADWSVYPAGTKFRISGLPWIYVIDDYGSALAGTGTIDIYHPTLEGMRAWGRRNVEITIIEWGSLEKSARILAGRAQHTHCKAMLDAIMAKFSRCPGGHGPNRSRGLTGTAASIDG